MIFRLSVLLGGGYDLSTVGQMWRDKWRIQAGLRSYSSGKIQGRTRSENWARCCKECSWWIYVRVASGNPGLKLTPQVGGKMRRKTPTPSKGKLHAGSWVAKGARFGDEFGPGTRRSFTSECESKLQFPTEYIHLFFLFILEQHPPAMLDRKLSNVLPPRVRPYTFSILSSRACKASLPRPFHAHLRSFSPCYTYHSSELMPSEALRDKTSRKLPPKGVRLADRPEKVGRSPAYAFVSGNTHPSVALLQSGLHPVVPLQHLWFPDHVSTMFLLTLQFRAPIHTNLTIKSSRPRMPKLTLFNRLRLDTHYRWWSQIDNSKRTS